MSEEKLTSLDYAELIKFAGYKYHGVRLNKTQLNKILFYAYGMYLAVKKKPMFDNESPHAWPYGPVFPSMNRKIDVDTVIGGFSHEKVLQFQKDVDAMVIVRDAVNRLYDKSAYHLTQWSHEEDSPWFKTMFPESGEEVPWDTVINDDLIKDYFTKSANWDV